jgi:hypothetical protein
MDVLHDNSFRTWTKIAAIVGEQQIPDYVRQYTPPDAESASSMSDDDFADPGKRAFPVDSKAATWLSAAYMLEKVAQYAAAGVMGGLGLGRALRGDWLREQEQAEAEAKVIDRFYGAASARKAAPPAVTNAPPAVTNAPPAVTNAPPAVTNAPPAVTNAPPALHKKGWLADAPEAMQKEAQLVTLLGALIGAIKARKGQRWRGAGHGALIGGAADIGMGVGGLPGTLAGSTPLAVGGAGLGTLGGYQAGKQLSTRLAGSKGSPWADDEKEASWLADAPEQRLVNAIQAWGIEDDVLKLAEAFDADAGQTKQAGDVETNYGWILKDASGNVTARRYGVFDPQGLWKASTYFDANRRHYPLATRTSIARFLLQKAAEYGVEYEQLPGSVLREAGYGVPRKSVIMRELNERAMLAKDAECGILLANVNRLLGTGSDQEIATNLDKIAQTIDAFDQAEDLTRHYGKRITHPSDFLCSVTFKQATAFVADTVQLRKLSFDVQKLVGESTFHKAAEIAMGPDFATSVTQMDAPKLAETLRALPLADRGALEDSILSLCD